MPRKPTISKRPAVELFRTIRRGNRRFPVWTKHMTVAEYVAAYCRLNHLKP